PDLTMPAEEPQEELIKISSVFSVSSAQPGKTYDAAIVVTVSPGWHINSSRPHQDWLIPAKLSFDTISGLTPHSIIYPQGYNTDLMGEKISVYDGRTIIRFRVTIDKNVPIGETDIPVRFTYQPCNDVTCRAPTTVETPLRIEVGKEGKLINPDVFNTVGEDREQQNLSAHSEITDNDLQRLIDKYGLWGYFLALGLAFVTGLLLSFSPCTYPMIPITVSIFAGQKRSAGRGFILSLFYVGSMAIVYGIMGLVVSLLGGVFGAWLASTPVVIGIAVVFVVFSLSMFGLYELQVPLRLRQKLGTAKTGGGVIGSIVLGIIAALVVSPCVGPFVAGILLYVATSGSPVIGFLMLFVFAVGLGTLYMIIGTFSSAISALPGSGNWMETVKKFFGFVLLLMAIYFLRTIISPTLTAILTGLILIAFGVFGGGLDRLTSQASFFERLKKYMGILALLVGVYLVMGTIVTKGLILPPLSHWLPAAGITATHTEHELIEWETNLETGLARAASDNRPVLIDTWATWCANCRVLDRKTFGNPEVANEAKRFVPIKVQLENTGTPITRDFMSRFGLKHYSLPTTLLIDSEGKVQRILRGVIDADDMITAMREVR
ncbi:MAG: cytochrome c biogenesis protein CcdA, partial [candidate division Zixibacteria bacterium]|nr:cytochrome c biogenesis protein CcdA [candidate division Zixibacteria bacterium]